MNYNFILPYGKMPYLYCNYLLDKKELFFTDLLTFKIAN